MGEFEQAGQGAPAKLEAGDFATIPKGTTVSRYHWPMDEPYPEWRSGVLESDCIVLLEEVNHDASGAAISAVWGGGEGKTQEAAKIVPVDYMALFMGGERWLWPTEEGEVNADLAQKFKAVSDVALGEIAREAISGKLGQRRAPAAAAAEPKSGAAPAAKM